MAGLSWAGRLVTYRDKCPALGTTGIQTFSSHPVSAKLLPADQVAHTATLYLPMRNAHNSRPSST